MPIAQSLNENNQTKLGFQENLTTIRYFKGKILSVFKRMLINTGVLC